MRLFFTIAIALTVIAEYSNAEVKQVRDYHLHVPRDRRIHFAMTVTPEQDILAFVMAADGNWRLSRLRGWLDREPLEQTIVVPGLAQGNPKQWFAPFAATLQITRDGRYVVCIASGIRRPSDGGDVEIVSVVDLREFKVLTSIHTEELPGFSGTLAGIQFDHAGRIVLQATRQIPRRPEDSPSEGGYDVTMALSTLPDLKIIEQCHYSQWIRDAMIRRDSGQDCADLLRNVVSGAPSSLDEFLTGLQEGDETLQQCRQITFGCSRHVSPYGQVESENAVTEHRGFRHSEATNSVFQ